MKASQAAMMARFAVSEGFDGRGFLMAFVQTLSPIDRLP